MTAGLVRQFTDFASLDAYLDGYAITGPRLSTLRFPATYCSRRTIRWFRPPTSRVWRASPHVDCAAHPPRWPLRIH